VVLSSSVSDYYFTLNWGNLGSEYFRVRRELNRVLNQLCYTIYTDCPIWLHLLYKSIPSPIQLQLMLLYGLWSRQLIVFLKTQLDHGISLISQHDLDALPVWVDKENSIESSFNFCTLLIHLSLFTSICKVPCAPLHPTLLLVWSLEKKRKEKGKKDKYWLSHFSKSWHPWGITPQQRRGDGGGKRKKASAL